MSFAKNYIKNFGLPVLTNEQKTKLLSLKKKESINSYVKELTVRKMSDLSKFSHYHEMTNSSDCWGNFKWQRNCSFWHC